MLKHAALILIALLSAGTAAADTCSGFPWTVTATAAGGASVGVHVCGTFAGCRPHAPTAVLLGSEIRVTVKQAELPDCICLQPVDDFEVNLIVPAVPPGQYDVVVFDQNCAQTTEFGRTTYSALASATIPTLDAAGLAALTLLICAAGIWRLRS
jgi:exosortase sorting signal-containing protein